MATRRITLKTTKALITIKARTPTYIKIENNVIRITRRRQNEKKKKHTNNISNNEHDGNKNVNTNNNNNSNHKPINKRS